MAEESLSILAYGPAGGGKTSLGLTGPQPTLYLDAETGSRFIPKHRKVSWNPLKDAPPVYDGSSWDICVVKITNWSIAQKVVEYLRSDQHQFQTVVIDSISEIQIKAKDEITRNAFQLQDWGKLNQNMGSFLRELRDITGSDSSKIRMMYLISTAKEYTMGEGKTAKRIWKPFLEGATANIVPYLFDITAYTYLEEGFVNPANPGEGKRIDQVFYTSSTDPNISAKARVPDFPPRLVSWTLEQMLQAVFFEEQAPQPEPVAVEPQPEPVAEEPQPQPAEKKAPTKTKAPKSASSGTPIF